MISSNLKKIIVQKPRILDLFRLGRSFSPFPLFYLVHLTLACNARCYFCYQKSPVFGAAKDFLKIEDFEKILKQAKSFLFKRPRIHFFGGEPLLHPQFAEFLKLTQKYGYPCGLTTNGILLSRYREQIALAENLVQMNVSLYGPSEVHDRIAGRGGIFDDIISNLRRLSEKAPKKKIVNINCVIVKENSGHLLELADYLNRFFAKGEISALVFQYPINKEICREIDAPPLRSAREKIQKTKFNFSVLFSAGEWREAIPASGSSFFPEGSCNVPWLGLGILPNLDVLSGGSVLTCSRALGNLKEKDLKEIWNGNELRELRKEILKRGLPSSCWGCCHAIL